MTADIAEAPTVSRSQRLSAATDDLHERLHGVVAAADPFSSRERFATWISVQYRFQREIEALYLAPGLQALLPDLADRSRLHAAEADLADLGTAVPTVEAPSHAGAALPEALGWLFVSEGSTLGAAILLKRAQHLGLSETFGARHLAAAPEGRARHWKQFTAAVDGLTLDADGEARLVAAARAAFQRFDVLLKEAFKLAP